MLCQPALVAQGRRGYKARGVTYSWHTKFATPFATPNINIINIIMQRAISPNIPPHESHTEWPTPTKAKLQGAIEYAEYLQRNNLSHTKQRAFDFYKINRRSAYRMLAFNDQATSNRGESARRSDNTSVSTKRGQPRKITKQEVQKMEEIINSSDINQRALSWQQLAIKVGLVEERKVHFHTVRVLMQSLEYHKCIACNKNWLSSHIRAERRRFARAYQH